MKPVFIEAVGLAAPGFENWIATQAVLRGDLPYVAQALSVYQPTLLPPNERRRATTSMRLAFRTAEEAIQQHSHPASELACVFSSSEGDTGILHRLCTALAESSPAVSPTDFHNSVHNAAAGYWSIATAARPPSISISAFDASFIAGLIETSTMCLCEHRSVLLVCYDMRPPDLLQAVRPIQCDAGVALLISPSTSKASLARIELSSSAEPETSMPNPSLEDLRLSNPACRALPLLQAIAQKNSAVLAMNGVGNSRWGIRVEPVTA